MFAYIIRRTFAVIPIVIGVMLLTFLLFRSIGGNPATRIAGKGASPARIAEISHRNGYDKPKVFGFWAEEMTQASAAKGVVVTKRADTNVYVIKPAPSRFKHTVAVPAPKHETTYALAFALKSSGGTVSVFADSPDTQASGGKSLVTKKVDTGAQTIAVEATAPSKAELDQLAEEGKPAPPLALSFRIEFEGDECSLTSLAVAEKTDGAVTDVKLEQPLPPAFKSKVGKANLPIAVLDPDYEKRYRLKFRVDASQGGSVRVYRLFRGVRDAERALLVEKEIPLGTKSEIAVAVEATTPQQEAAPEVLTEDNLPTRLAVSFHVEFEGAEAMVSRVEAFRRQSNPFDAQLWHLMRDLVRFEFGTSKETRQRVSFMMLQGLGPSLAISVPAFFLNVITTISLALICAYYRNSLLDRSLVVLAVMGMSLNVVIMCILVQNWAATNATLFGIPLGLHHYGIPVWGFEGARYLILPLMIGLVTGIGGGLRFYRTIMLNERYSDYVRTALAKGVTNRGVMFKHVLKNAMIPILTNVVVGILFLYTGQLLLENFFGIPGLGMLTVQAIQNGDEAVLFASVYIGTIVFVFANLVTDISYAAVDPRIRLK